MTETRALTLQMLEWIGPRSRGYAEVMEAWRTSCPRLSIWEDACLDGLVERDPVTGRVAVTPKGLTLLQSQRRASLPGGGVAIGGS
jgi:hypothetical protein